MKRSTEKRQRCARSHLAAAVFLLASLAALCLPALAIPGAVWTTNDQCIRVDANIYPSKQAVWLNGGPNSAASGAEFEDGVYYVKVTSPEGVLLGTSVLATNPTPFVVVGGELSPDCIHLWDIVVKASDSSVGYDDTPNMGGEYKVWVSKNSTFTHNVTKTDNFKVDVCLADTTPPLLTGQGPDHELECPAEPDFTPPTGSDDNGTTVIVYSDKAIPGVCPGAFSLTRTWTATDKCGNVSAPVSQTITYKDTSNPLLSGEGDDKTVECSDEIVFDPPTATDTCDHDAIITYSDETTPGDCPGNYTITRTWTATDDCQNVSPSVSQTITVHDTTKPELTGEGDDDTIECPEEPSFTEPTATDNCDDNPTITFSDETTPGDCAGNYSITRTWIAKDACNNESDPVSQTITVQDTTKPVLSGEGDDETIECPIEPSFTEPTATDTCDSNPTISHSDETVPGDCPGNYSITRTWIAKDACGNESDPVSQTITVEDTTKPELGGEGADETIECPATPSFKDPTATDLCDGNPTISHSDETTPGSCPGEYFVTRTWTAKDACGNESDPVSQTITVKDTTKPVLTGEGDDETIECPATPSFTPPTASDTCDQNPQLAFRDTTTPGNCPGSYSVTRVWRAKDACGNASDPVSQTITVKDTTKPELTGQGADDTIECPAEPSFTEPTATDTCDSEPSISHSDETVPGDCPGSYSITRTWTAKDCSGNESDPVSQTITVVDTTKPVLTGEGDDKTIECPDEPSFTEPTASDTCDNNPTISHSDNTVPGACAGTYVITRTWTAKDCSGNESDPVSQSITVKDTSKPVLSGEGDDKTIECPATPDFTAPTVTDTCDNNPTLASRDTTVPGDCPGSYVITRVWRAKDCAGNVSDPVSQTITVKDTTKPVLTGEGDDKTIECQETPEFTEPTASDTCDGNPVISHSDNTVPGACAGTYVITRTWTAKDCSGNVSDPVSQSITVKDSSKPVLSGQGSNKTIECPEAPSFTAPTVSDTCDSNPTLASRDTTVPGACPGSYSITRVWRAKDCAGNVSDPVSQTITVKDTTKPVLSGQGDDKTIECPATPDFTPPTASDTCDGNPTVSHSDNTVPGACPGTFSITRTWTAKDCSGNVSDPVSQTITVKDTGKPVLSGQGPDKTIECPASPSFTAPTVTDTCDSNPTLASRDTTVPGACPGSYVITRVWRAKDCAGNVSDPVSQTITVSDTTGPTLAQPANIAKCLKTINGTLVTCAPPTATDTCDPNPTVTGTRSDNQPLTAPYPLGVTTITWTPKDCSGNIGTPKTQTVTITGATICPKKFLDCDFDGVKDSNEAWINGWKMTLTGTDSAGNLVTRPAILTPNCFTDLPQGTYRVCEAKSLTGTWIATTATTVTVVVSQCAQPLTATFGNACMGAGGGHTPGFWSNKNGEALVGPGDLSMLVAQNLRNANGTDFNPATYAALNTWLLNGNATNMAYMLSVHLAAMRLNVYNGFVNGYSLVYAPGLLGSNTAGFISINALMTEANTELGLHGYTPSGNPDRAYQDKLKSALDKANNNLNFASCTVGSFSF